MANIARINGFAIINAICGNCEAAARLEKGDFILRPYGRQGVGLFFEEGIRHNTSNELVFYWSEDRTIWSKEDMHRNTVPFDYEGIKTLDEKGPMGHKIINILFGDVDIPRATESKRFMYDEEFRTFINWLALRQLKR